MNVVHPTAIIEPGAVIGSGNVFGPFCHIGARVTIGNNNTFSSGVVIGGPPRQSAHPYSHGYMTNAAQGVGIGDRCFFEEHVIIHEGLHLRTEVSDTVALGAHSYVAHDTRIGTGCTFAASVRLGGYGIVGEGANFGMGATVHQRCAIGAWSMIGANATVLSHIPPGATVVGCPARYLKANDTGLLRARLTRADCIVAADYLERGVDPPEGRFHDALVEFERDRRRWGRADRLIEGLWQQHSLGAQQESGSC